MAMAEEYITETIVTAGKRSEFEATADVDEVSLMLKSELGFLMEIRNVTEALNKLNHFLKESDAKSVERLTSEFAESLSKQANENTDEYCIVKLFDALQEGRIVNFLRTAHRWSNKVDSARNENGATGRGGVIEERNQRVVYSFINEYFDSSEKSVIGWLAEESPMRSILSLPDSDSRDGISYGELIYGNLAAREFDRPYWINVSGLYKIRNQLNIMAQVPQKLGEVLRVRRIMERIDKTMRHSVERNRYIFVLDNVFHEEFWRVLEQSLISTGANNDQVRQLGPLSYAESWELFRRIAFHDEPEQLCPVELQFLSRELVAMCKGFPLPIVGIAGLLSKREKLELEWERVRGSFKVEVRTTLHLPRVLGNDDRASFHDLPSHLRVCLLYFALFPPDSVIPNEKLYKLWVAEGFVHVTRGKTLEDVAEEYLNELISRNLVQSYRGLNRLERFCKLDRSTLQITLLHAEGFCDNAVEHVDLVLPLKGRRLSLSICDDVDPKKFDSDLHSLFVFAGFQNVTFLVDLIGQCRELTVLDFEYHPIGQIPEDVGKLIHLKYLSLKNSNVRKLPKSLDKLVNLQTLDVRNTLLVKLPIEINKLKSLRHLLASVYDDVFAVNPSRGVRLYQGIGSLQNLHTLTMVEVHNNSILTELSELQRLRTLSVSGLTAGTAKALCACVDKLGKLKSLTLQSKNDYEVLDLASISSELPLLQRLVLKGRFQNIPDWIFRLRNLNVLCFSLMLLTEDQLMLLSLLPNLVTLWLCRVYSGEQVCFKQGGFEKLKFLVVREFRGLYKLEIEDGALPCLEELRIGSSPFLNEVPSGIQYLKNLRILINYDMPIEFAASIQPDEGSEYWKVENIDSVFFLFRVQGRKYKLFELGDSELLDHLHGLSTNAYHVTEPLDEHEFSCNKSNEEEVDDGDVVPLRLFEARSTISQRNTGRWSFSSGFYTDDFEE